MHASSQVSQVRVRFAPSPTGFLHIGGVRVALFNWLYARQQGGKFLLRIEDTDLERSEDRFTQDILNSLQWLGLISDEDPLYQSQRLEIYRNQAEEWIQLGHAYRCYCTESEVEQMRTQALAEGKKPQYDRRCRNQNHPASSEKPYVIRARIPLTGSIDFEDLIRGPIHFENAELDDFVLIRSNGAPTYQLSVVVDDIASGITHILRGDDHLNNTPKQIHLYQFYGQSVPKFAHLPMILGADKKKLSKRHGAVSACFYRDEGYLPAALLNFLARLGWSHGDQEVFSKEELIEYFSFEHVQKSAAVFQLEKLLWLNGVHLRSAPASTLRDHLLQDGILRNQQPPFSFDAIERLKTPLGIELVGLLQPKVKLLKELAEQLIPLCTPGTCSIPPDAFKWVKSPQLKAPIQAAIQAAVEFLDEKIKTANASENSPEAWGGGLTLGMMGWTSKELETFFRTWAEKYALSLGELTQPMRFAVTGRAVSAGLFDLMSLLPWDLVAARLKTLAFF